MTILEGGGLDKGGLDKGFYGIKKEKVIQIEVPRYKELSVDNIWKLVEGVQDIMQYFPDYKANQLPNREFMFGILATFCFDIINNMVQIARKNRSVKALTDESNLVHIAKAFYDEIKDVATQKCSLNIVIL